MSSRTLGGADLLCLTPTGAVVFWDGYHETHPMYPVAPTFEAFLAMLYRNEDSQAFEPE